VTSAAATTTTTTIAIVSCYLSIALLLSMGALVLTALLRWGSSFAARAPERFLAVGWSLLVLALTLPSAWRVAGITHTAGAPLEIWSGPRVDSGDPPPAQMTIRWTAAPAARGAASMRNLPEALGLGIAALAGGALLSLVKLIVQRRRLGQRCAELPVVKRVGSVCLCASDEAPAPFAARAGGLSFIVLPTSLLADMTRLRMVIAHEAHHHRRADLHTAAVLGVVRALFFWNPLLSLWERAIAELQDLACDRHVLRRPRVSSIEYGRVLLWAAEAVRGRRYVVFGARGIADGSAHSLARRIVMLNQMPVDRNDRRRARTRSWLLGVAASALMVGTSWMVQGAVTDHRVTRSQVEGLAARIEKRSGFPVFVDDRVVVTLNQWVAVPGTRDRMKKAMERMPNYRGMIERTMKARGLPVELLGMVMAESAFDNEAHPDTPVEARSAGIWQIIPGTGRKLGLEVSPDQDERLEPRKATEAAAALVAKLFARYGDWPVAIAAYNAGEDKVDSLAARATSKADVRARVLAGQDEHARYVRSVMASVILIENPSLLE
jgi:membrane-bound lytic murein transglycosylase D